MPPKPVLTRFGTWLEATEYYCENFDAVRSVVGSFDPGDSNAIAKAQIQFAVRETKSELAFIKANFSVVTRAITKLQEQGLELSDSAAIYEAVMLKMKTLKRKEFAEKFEAVQTRNVGYKTLTEIRDILYEGNGIENSYIEKLSPDELVMFKFSPTTSCDVERYFSAYKMVFDIRRKSFSFENLKKHLIVYCNQKLVIDDDDDEVTIVE